MAARLTCLFPPQEGDGQRYACFVASTGPRFFFDSDHLQPLFLWETGLCHFLTVLSSPHRIFSPLYVDRIGDTPPSLSQTYGSRRTNYRTGRATFDPITSARHLRLLDQTSAFSTLTLYHPSPFGDTVKRASPGLR